MVRRPLSIICIIAGIIVSLGCIAALILGVLPVAMHIGANLSIGDGIFRGIRWSTLLFWIALGFISMVIASILFHIAGVTKIYGRKEQKKELTSHSSPLAQDSLGTPPNSQKIKAPFTSEVVIPSPVKLVTNIKLILPDRREVLLSGKKQLLGRDDFSKFISSESLNFISRQHLLIKNENERYFIEDSNSANGTKVNGIDIKGKGQQELKNGDTIELAGITTLTFTVE